MMPPPADDFMHRKEGIISRQQSPNTPLMTDDASLNKTTARSESDVDDTITRAIGGTSLATLGSSSSTIPQDDPFLHGNLQQVRRTQSMDMRVTRSQARRARRNHYGRQNTSPNHGGSKKTLPRTNPQLASGSISGDDSLTSSIRTNCSLPPILSDRDHLASSICTEGGLVMLDSDVLLMDPEPGRVGDDLVGTSIVSRARDCTASARSRDSQMSAKPPLEYRQSNVVEKEQARPPPNEENRPGAFAIPRRAYGGVPAWFEEALQRRRQQQQGECAIRMRMARRGSSVRSNNSGSSRRLSLQSLRQENCLQVFARLHEGSNRTSNSVEHDDDDNEGDVTERDTTIADTTNIQRLGVARPIGSRRWSSVQDFSSVPEASCMMANHHGDANTGRMSMDAEEDSKEATTSDSSRLDSVFKPLVKIVTSPMQRFRKKNKKQHRRSRSVEF